MSYLQYDSFLPDWRGVTLGKPNIKVETVNKESHSLEEEAADVSTTTRMVKAMYSVSRHLSDSVEGCGEELMGHEKPTRRGLQTQCTSIEHATTKHTGSTCTLKFSIYKHIVPDTHTVSLLDLWVTGNLITELVRSHLSSSTILGWKPETVFSSPLPLFLCYPPSFLSMCVFRCLMV